MKTYHPTFEEDIRILLVEDSPTQAAELRFMLEEHGYHVDVARDGHAALAAANARQPTIIISDIVMPNMDGYELCRRIKADNALRDIPVILLTSLSDPVDVIRGLECGADNFIVKPYETRYLLSRIAYMLLNRHVIRTDVSQMGLEILFAGQKFFITSDRLQILNLLLSTYETAVRQNHELVETRDKLQDLNDSLELKVRERTAELEAEVEERRRAEHEVRRLNAELEARVQARTADLEAANHDLESFSYSVSHDLRAPLRSIHAMAGLVMEEAGTLPGQLQNYLVRISENVKRMNTLIDDLLKFSKLGRQPLSMKPVSHAPLLEAILEDVRSDIEERSIEVVLTSLPPSMGDASLLRQVWQNLVGNAVKYTRSCEHPRVEIGSTVGADGQIVYYVRDNGVGFDMAYADRLFGVFQRLHPARLFEGNGVGLATAQRIIHRHSGKIWAEAEEGKGATFFFTLNPAPAASVHRDAPEEEG